ncbi:hypothetical protein PMIN01_04044 [Paraphaeosphaeria minitans]|uniref:Uncharacterized protein n=1 Tax=Paraphaeosphaeria minitans TaxID=565426 RepID=A0A9P6KUA0_9PLEO|nr:hypothetical protein PMIN01_04044 [Paraphaeosphaeria minitans]
MDVKKKPSAARRIGAPKGRKSCGRAHADWQCITGPPFVVVRSNSLFLSPSLARSLAPCLPARATVRASLSPRNADWIRRAVRHSTTHVVRAVGYLSAQPAPRRRNARLCYPRQHQRLFARSAAVHVVTALPRATLVYKDLSDSWARACDRVSLRSGTEPWGTRMRSSVRDAAWIMETPLGSWRRRLDHGDAAWIMTTPAPDSDAQG